MIKKIIKIFLVFIILLLVVSEVFLYFNYKNYNDNKSNNELTNKDVDKNINEEVSKEDTKESSKEENTNKDVDKKDDNKDTETNEEDTKKETDDSELDEEVTEEESSDSEKSIFEKAVISSQEWDKIKDNYVCKNTYNFLSVAKSELETLVRNVPLEQIAKGELTYTELMNIYILVEAEENVSTLKSLTYNYDGSKVLYDKNGNKYHEDTYREFKDFGFTVEEISASDLILWFRSMGGCYQCGLLKDVNELKNYLKNKYGTYGEIFDSSFQTSSCYLDYYEGEMIGCDILMYDKNIDKFFVNSGGGVASNYQTAIFDTKENGDYYTIKFSTVEFDMGSYDIKLDSKNTIKTGYTASSNKSYEDIIKEYKDKVPNYEVTFKLNSNNKYEFYDIKKTK